MPRPLLFALVLSSLLAGCGNAGRVDTACRSNGDCAETELCALNFCTGLGFCEARPDSCDPEDVSLVCGCDGITYPNSTCAAFDGVRLASTVPCTCNDNSECADFQYCALENSCENIGACLDRPESCEPVSEPVCGCDFSTYENACEAAQAGVRVSANGECDCQSNDDCATDEYCNAIVCDGPGVCTLRTDCVVEGSVVGCDGAEYADQCAAAEAGVRVRPDE